MDYRDEMSDDELDRRKLVVKICAVVALAIGVNSFFRDSPHDTVAKGTICPDGNAAVAYNPAQGRYTDEWAINEPALEYVCLKPSS